MKFTYPAVFRQDNAGRFHAFFPDLEGCVAEGDTFEEAFEKAKEAEETWIQVELEDTWELPPITHIEDLNQEKGDIIRQIAVRIKLEDDYDS